MPLQTAGTAEQKYRQPQFCRLFNCPGDFLADHMPHTAHHKFGFADADHSLFPVDLAFTYGHSFFYAGFFPGLRQLFFIALIFQWIALFYLLEPGPKAFPVCHHADPIVGLHPEIITTLIADIFIFDDTLFIQFFFADFTGNGRYLKRRIMQLNTNIVYIIEPMLTIGFLLISTAFLVGGGNSSMNLFVR